MCVYSKRRLLPLGATNGQILVYNSATNRWEAQDNVGGGGGGAGFNPALDYLITGDWQFSKPIYHSEYTGSVGAPINGYLFYSPEPAKISKIFSTGFTVTEDYSLLTADREIRFPDAGGTLALRDVGMLRLANTLDANFQPVYDNNGNQSDLKINLTGVAVTNLILENAAHFINFYGINTAAFNPNFAYNHGTGVVTNTGADFIWKSTGSLNNFEIDTTSAFFGMGHNSPVKLGAALSTFQAANGVYFNASTGFQSDWANYAYTLNASNHIYNGALSGSSLMNAGMLNLGSHTFGVQHASAATLNYNGINLGFSINNTVASTGFAFGLNINANLTNLNGMQNRGIYYSIDGAGAATPTINSGASIATNSTRGIIFQNNRAATTGQQSYAPGISFISNVWQTQTGGSVTNTWDILPTGGQQFGNNSILSFYNNGQHIAFFEGGVGLTVGHASNPIGIISTSLQLGPRSNSTLANHLSCFMTLAAGFAATAGDPNGFRFGNPVGQGGFNPTSGNATLTGFRFDPTINQTGGASGITRGLWINPTLTAAADFRAIDVEVGSIFFKNLATANTGRVGQIYRDGENLKIVI